MQAIEQSSLINQDALIQLIKSEVDKQVAKQSFEPRTAGLTQQVRKDYFHGKGVEWIRTFIFDRYPETNEANGGWVTNPRKSVHGKTTTIWLKPARKWLDDHELEIDWNEKMPT